MRATRGNAPPFLTHLSPSHRISASFFLGFHSHLSSHAYNCITVSLLHLPCRLRPLHSGGSCTGFTWHDATCSGYEHLCYLVSNSNPWSGGERLLGHFSALCTQPPPPEPLVGQCSAIINSANLVSNLPPGTWLANATCQSAADCEASCKANSTCSGFTWHDKNVGGYALNCFFTDVRRGRCYRRRRSADTCHYYER